LSFPVPVLIVTSWFSATALVAIAKLTAVAPSGTKTLAGGRTSAVSVLTSVTTAPPAGAACSSVTVPVTEVPPTTLS